MRRTPVDSQGRKFKSGLRRMVAESLLHQPPKTEDVGRHGLKSAAPSEFSCFQPSQQPIADSIRRDVRLPRRYSKEHPFSPISHSSFSRGDIHSEDCRSAVKSHNRCAASPRLSGMICPRSVGLSSITRKSPRPSSCQVCPSHHFSLRVASPRSACGLLVSFRILRQRPSSGPPPCAIY